MTDFRFTVKEYSISQTIGEKDYPIDCIGIGLLDTKLNVVYPLPITDFIIQTYRRKLSGSISTQRNAAYEICKFLNFCMDMKNKNHIEFECLKTRGLFGLKLIHGSLYISELSLKSREGELNANYVRKIIRYLNKFYDWLRKQNLLDVPIDSFYKKKTIHNEHGGVNTSVEFSYLGDIFDDPELGTIYPPKRSIKQDKLHDFGKNRYKIVKEFLDIADEIAPDISLGIAFQFFGGLRKGEVVNLTTDSIMKTPNGFYLSVSDRQHILFADKKTTSSEQVKIPRNQSLLWNTYLEIRLEEHLNNLENLRNKGKIKIPNALFVSSSTGEPINGKSYWYHFNRVKDAFLEKLSKEARIDEFLNFSNKSWSTHLCRGVFTHFCIDAGLSLSEIGIARGDASLDSLLDYIEISTVAETMSEALDNLKTSLDNDAQSGFIPLNKQNTWRDLRE